MKSKNWLFHIFLHLKLYYKIEICTSYPHLVNKFWENSPRKLLIKIYHCWYVDKSVYLFMVFIILLWLCPYNGILIFLYSHILIFFHLDKCSKIVDKNSSQNIYPHWKNIREFSKIWYIYKENPRIFIHGKYS